MDSKNYIFMKMEESFSTTYYISDIENGQITQHNTPNQPLEQFNSLDKKCIDNNIDTYHFTFRQSKPNMS